MRSLLSMLFLGAILLSPGCNGSQEGPEETPPPPSAAKEWELLWSDEFDYTGQPDPDKWRNEVGFIRNNQLQYYTTRPENIHVNDGKLTITARKEQYPNANYKPGSDNWREKNEFASYTSASLNTKGKFAWTYGKIEVKARIPGGQGVWLAIWTLGDNVWEVDWPKCGEVDILEYVGREPNTVHTNIHYEKASDGRYSQHQKSRVVPGMTDDFHVYSMEWDEEKMVIFVDGIAVNTFDNRLAGTTFINKAQYLLLTLAIGGDWAGEVDDSIFPVVYEIDYVRVYKEKEKK